MAEGLAVEPHPILRGVIMRANCLCAKLEGLLSRGWIGNDPVLRCMDSSCMFRCSGGSKEAGTVKYSTSPQACDQSGCTSALETGRPGTQVY
jgi:hypothetical protein